MSGLPPMDGARVDDAPPRALGSSLWRAVRDRIGSLLNTPSNALVRRLLSDQGAKHWKGYAFAFAMMALIAVTTSLSAWIIGRIVDKIFVGRNLKAVWEITAAIVAIYTVKGLATYGQQVVLSRVANNIVADIQKRIFDQMLRMKVSYYSRSHSSEFIARQAFIAQSASGALNLLITTFARDALTIVGLVVVMVSQDPLLSLFALMFLPLAAVGVRKIGLRVRKIMASEFQGAMQMMEFSAGDGAGHSHRQGLHPRELHARSPGERDRRVRESGEQARAGEFPNQPDHGEFSAASPSPSSCSTAAIP